jgi:hypothetical protein
MIQLHTFLNTMLTGCMSSDEAFVTLTLTHRICMKVVEYHGQMHSNTASTSRAYYYCGYYLCFFLFDLPFKGRSEVERSEVRSVFFLIVKRIQN